MIETIHLIHVQHVLLMWMVVCMLRELCHDVKLLCAITIHIITKIITIVSKINGGLCQQLINGLSLSPSLNIQLEHN